MEKPVLFCAFVYKKQNLIGLSQVWFCSLWFGFAQYGLVFLGELMVV